MIAESPAASSSARCTVPLVPRASIMTTWTRRAAPGLADAGCLVERVLRPQPGMESWRLGITRPEIGLLK